MVALEAGAGAQSFGFFPANTSRIVAPIFSRVDMKVSGIFRGCIRARMPQSISSVFLIKYQPLDGLDNCKVQQPRI